MIKGFAHVCLASADLAASERFYCAGLGFKKAFDFMLDGRSIGFYLEIVPGQYIEIFQRAELPAKANGPLEHFCLEVDDLELVRRRLAENGYETTQKILGADQSWQLWATDPGGVKIEFHQYTVRSLQHTHQNCVLK